MPKRQRLAIFWMLALFSTAAVLAGSKEAQAKSRIALTEFSVEPTHLKLGETFVLRATAKATGVPLGSFLLRTADEVPRSAAIPGLPLHSNGKWYMAEKSNIYLFDNGAIDEAPEEGTFAVRISTEGWKEGVTRFAFFASRRPNPGSFVAARHDFSVAIRGDEVVVEDLGGSDLDASRAIRSFCAEPSVVEPGQPVRISVRIDYANCKGMRITNPFYIAAPDTLPGFAYDAERKKSYFGTEPQTLLRDNGPADRDDAAGCVAVELATEEWRPGAHHFLFELVGNSGNAIDQRSFAVMVGGPHDQLKVTVESSYEFIEGTHFGRFLKLRDGTLFCEDRVSEDGGRSWQAGTQGFGAGGEQLLDGTVLGLAYRCLPVEENEGWYDCERSFLNEDKRTFRKDQSRFFVPQAKPAMGHGPHKGPLFMRSIIERGDGTLVALMAGWFQGDTALCPYGRGRPYSRSYVCESSDRGESWQYLTTIGYDHLGSEGYNEGSMRCLPSGEWLAVIRTGNERDIHCQDNPIMWSVSHDEGRTWSVPQRTGVEGAYPSLAVLSDGLLVMSYGRPGAMLVFSHDNGRTWTDQTVVDVTPYSGYTDVVELEPGHLLVGFGAKGFLDPTTGERDDQLRLARVRYED